MIVRCGKIRLKLIHNSFLNIFQKDVKISLKLQTSFSHPATRQSPVNVYIKCEVFILLNMYFFKISHTCP